MKTQFLKVSHIKKYVHERDRRTSPSFLLALDAYVQTILDRAVKAHNGGKKTIDAEVAGFVGVKP